MSDVVNNSNIDWLQGNTTYIIISPSPSVRAIVSYCPEGSQYYLNITNHNSITLVTYTD